MTPEVLSLAFAAALGLIIGSYLNVVVYRLPRGVSTARPGSRCPRCVMPIRPWDNVPVLGWLWLGAKCRDCGLGISVRYPLVEAAMGGWFVLCHLRAGSMFEGAVASFFGAVLLVLALIDADHLRVPVGMTLMSGLIGLAAQPWLNWVDPTAGTARALELSILGIFAGAAAVLCLVLAGRALGVEDGLALGDAYVLAMIGAFLGWRGMVATFFFGATVALLWYGGGFVLGLLRPGSDSKRLTKPIPFVIFLSMGAAMVLLAGPLSGHS